MNLDAFLNIANAVMALVVASVGFFMIIRIIRWVASADDQFPNRPKGGVWYETKSGRWLDKDFKEL